MSDFYTDLRAVASDVIEEFKQGEVKLIQLTTGSGTPDNPGTPTETEVPLAATVKGVSFKFVKDGFATSTDLMVSAAVIVGVTHSMNDFVEIDGTRYKIIHDASVPSAGVKLVWKFIVRKGG